MQIGQMRTASAGAGHAPRAATPPRSQKKCLGRQHQKKPKPRHGRRILYHVVRGNEALHDQRNRSPRVYRGRGPADARPAAHRGPANTSKPVAHKIRANGHSAQSRKRSQALVVSRNLQIRKKSTCFVRKTGSRSAIRSIIETRSKE